VHRPNLALHLLPAAPPPLLLLQVLLQVLLEAA
jgi:hypothetical protein